MGHIYNLGLFIYKRTSCVYFTTVGEQEYFWSRDQATKVGVWALPELVELGDL